MKTSKLYFLLLLAVVFTGSACEDDDGMMMPVCTQDTWVGNYSGTVSCDDGATSTPITITITASGTDAVAIRTQSNSTSTFYDPITIDNCTLMNSGTLGGVTASVEVTLDGDNLTIRDVTMGGGFDEDCTITATRD